VHVTDDAPSRAAADLDTRTPPAPEVATESLRVGDASSADRGIFETFLGALIGFLFG
jgi:hypothetical protein